MLCGYGLGDLFAWMDLLFNKRKLVGGLSVNFCGVNQAGRTSVFCFFFWFSCAALTFGYIPGSEMAESKAHAFKITAHSGRLPCAGQLEPLRPSSISSRRFDHGPDWVLAFSQLVFSF